MTKVTVEMNVDSMFLEDSPDQTKLEIIENVLKAGARFTNSSMDIHSISIKKKLNERYKFEVDSEVRERFLEHGIPYDEIDPEMINLIDVLNFEVGLKTQFCCYGHEAKEKSFVIFDKNITEEQILSLLEQMSKQWEEKSKLRYNNKSVTVHVPVFFYKWVRANPVMINWQMEFTRSYVDPNDPEKQKYLDLITEILRTCKI